MPQKRLKASGRLPKEQVNPFLGRRVRSKIKKFEKPPPAPLLVWAPLPDIKPVRDVTTRKEIRGSGKY